MKIFLKWSGILLALSACSLAAYGAVRVQQYQTLVDEEPHVVLSPDHSDLTYCSMDGVPLKMDLYFPESEDGTPQVLLYIHGGSFTGGDKRKGSGVIDIPAMTARGYAVAAINCRRLPENPFPAEVMDAKCAIRFLRAHAVEYRWRTEKIGLWGGGAGGHLAAMIGLTNGDPKFEAGQYPDRSSHVDAVVEMFGPTDLTRITDWLQRLLLRRAFGTDAADSPLLQEASPVNYVTGDAPPFLILHGEQDAGVPVEQGRLLFEKLSRSGVDATFVIVRNANHNFKPTAGEIDPSREKISSLMADFFDLQLK